MSRTERTVVLSPLDPKDATQILTAQSGATRLSDVEGAIPQFKKLEFPAFKVEFEYSTGDVIVHFFLPKRKVTEHYWKVLFAEALEEIGQAHFQATRPRLVARYTEELHSWWFKAQNYGHLIDLETYVIRFFEKLAERMGPALEAQSRGA